MAIFVVKIWQFYKWIIANDTYMSKAAKNILTLNHDEAMDFFMKSELYHGFELLGFFASDTIINTTLEE